MPARFVLAWGTARTRGRSARAARAIRGSAASLNRPIAFDGGYHSSRLGARHGRFSPLEDCGRRPPVRAAPPSWGRHPKTLYKREVVTAFPHGFDRRPYPFVWPPAAPPLPSRPPTSSPPSRTRPATHVPPPLPPPPTAS